MKNKHPLVSIIIPAYNTEKYVGFCLSSLISQTYKNIEIIVIDDGATDGTGEIIRDYAVQDNRVQLVRGEHQGANVARGLGVKEARGDYYMFVDSDDWLERDAIEKLIDAMEKNHCDAIRFNAAIEPSGRLKNPFIGRNAANKMLDGDEARRVLVMKPILNNLCFQFYRANLFDKIGSFKEKLSNCEDHLVNLEIYGSVKSVLFIGDVLYHYRSNYNSTTKNSDADRRMTNLNEQIYVYSLMLGKFDAWHFSAEERTKAAVVALDKVRSGIFAFSKANGVNKKKFVQSMKNVLKNEDFQFIRRSVGIKENIKAFLREQPLPYKIKCGKSLEYLYDEKSVSFWRSTFVFRALSRVRQKIATSKNTNGGYNNVAKYMRGRLGNQLFQYAALRYIQEINHDGGGMRLNFSKYVYSLGFKNDLGDFRVRPYAEIDKIHMPLLQKIIIFTDKLIKRAYRFVRPRSYKEFRYNLENKRAEKLQRLGIYWKEDGALRMKPTRYKSKIAIGHFESAKNFDTLREQLLEELQPIKPPLAKNRKLYDLIEQNESVCVSIRRGDYVENPTFAKKYNVCGKEYFEAAVGEIRKRVKKPVFVLFSDDIGWCKKNIKLPGEKVYFEDGTDPVWEKLRLMYSCKHFIISNSTFSWWAQYLSRNEKKVVVAPKVWSNSGYNKDIYDASWVIVDNACVRRDEND